MPVGVWSGTRRHRRFERGPAAAICTLIGRQIDRAPTSACPPGVAIRVIHRVHAVGDPARAPHVLPLHPGRGLTGLFLPGLIQRHHHQPRPGPEVLGHETADRRHRRVVVPHRVVQQPLCAIRPGIPDMLRDRPAVLPRQITHQRRHILPRLHTRLRPSKTRRQPLMRRSQIRHRPLALYHDSRSRLMFSLSHNLIIARRLPL